MNRDSIVVGQAVAALGSSATVEAVAGLLGVPTKAVEQALDDLSGCGLAWPAADVIRLPKRLAMRRKALAVGVAPAQSLVASPTRTLDSSGCRVLSGPATGQSSGVEKRSSDRQHRVPSPTTIAVHPVGDPSVPFCGMMLPLGVRRVLTRT
jgi:hypothetical protein